MSVLYYFDLGSTIDRQRLRYESAYTLPKQNAGNNRHELQHFMSYSSNFKVKSAAKALE
jgi:hypothetical protein